jgi:hypothetical protein
MKAPAKRFGSRDKCYSALLLWGEHEKFLATELLRIHMGLFFKADRVFNMLVFRDLSDAYFFRYSLR